MVAISEKSHYESVIGAQDIELVGEAEELFLQQYKTIASKYGLESRLGIYVPHRHVPIRKGEVFAHVNLGNGRRMCLPTPYRGEHLVANHFRFVKSADSPTLIAEEFQSDLEAVDPLNPIEEAFIIEEVLPLLTKHGMEDRLGVFLLEDQADPTTYWFESVDEESRTMHMVRLSRNDEDFNARYATHFRVDMQKTDMNLAEMAHMACKPMCDRDVSVSLGTMAYLACKPMCDR